MRSIFLVPVMCSFSLALCLGCGGDDAAPDSGPGRADAGGDSAAGDAGDGGAVVDAAGPDDGGESCSTCIGESLRWGFMGGFTLYEDTSTISDCRQYTLVRVMSGTSGMMSCTNDVPCSGVDLITMGDVLNALAHPDVVAAFAAGTLYGRDNRAADGQVFSIVRGTTAGFLVGDPCDGDPSCLPIPPGVETLIMLLQTLDTERRAEEDCATVFPP